MFSPICDAAVSLNALKHKREVDQVISGNYDDYSEGSPKDHDELVEEVRQEVAIDHAVDQMINQ